MESDPTGPDFLGEAAFAGNVARIRFLLSVGVSPDAADRAGFRALHRCAVSGNVGAAETLLEAGAEVNLTDAVRACRVTCVSDLRGYDMP
jgi:ankyrin repeat protein